MTREVAFPKNDIELLFQVDFANRESQMAFYQSMEKTGQDIRDFYEMLVERRQVSLTHTGQPDIGLLPAGHPNVKELISRDWDTHLCSIFGVVSYQS